MHGEMVPNPDDQDSQPAHPLPHPGSSAANPRRTAIGAAEPEHAGAQAQGVPHRGHCAGIPNGIGVEGVSSVGDGAWDQDRDSRTEGE